MISIFLILRERWRRAIATFPNLKDKNLIMAISIHSLIYFSFRRQSN
ncbi:MAG: hypothetical protein ACFCU7_17570 [Pleurocapsa sp.]